MRQDAKDASGDARQKDLVSRVSSPLAFVLKAWPMIAAATIGLCFATQGVAKLLGIDLPEQTNIEIVKRCLTHAFASWKAFGVAALLVFQVIALLPALEEFLFRGLLFKLPSKKLSVLLCAILSSVLFSAAHYIAQPWPDNAFLALFFFGLAQCWLYRRTGCIWCAMLNHGLFNLTNLILLFIFPEAA